MCIHDNFNNQIMALRNSQNCKIGLLPLYLELYDEVMPEIRKEFDPLIDTICNLFKSKEIDTVLSDVCRISNEFENAVAQFENADVDCIVTLHLAYSPSLECINALSKTKLPIIVLDTTRDDSFNSISLLMYNHGIHGVQDMCNMLLRRGKEFIIEAGHIELSDVIDRIVSHIKGARIAHLLRNSRVGRIGEVFTGMGDFIVERSVLESKLGITEIVTSPDQVAKYLPDENDPEILTELAKDKQRFDVSDLKTETHKLSIQTGLALRRWIENENISAFTINFRAIIKESGMPEMPFLEICKLLSEGIGYAGEGDVLTAAFVGAMAQVLGEVSFTEMFCPDWENNIIFMSHMGEMNIDLIDDKARLVEKEWSYTNAQPPVYPSACFKSGRAVFVNLAPGVNNTFSLIISPIEMVKEGQSLSMGDGIRGWMKPEISISEFLKKYSEVGGTHHAAIVYGRPINELKSFGKIMGWKVIEI
jgi:L-arabinose isomerase